MKIRFVKYAFLPIFTINKNINFNYLDLNSIFNFFSNNFLAFLNFDILDILTQGKISVLESKIESLEKKIQEGQFLENENLKKISNQLDSIQTENQNNNYSYYIGGFILLGTVLAFFYFYGGDTNSDNFKAIVDSTSNVALNLTDTIKSTNQIGTDTVLKTVNESSTQILQGNIENFKQSTTLFKECFNKFGLILNLLKGINLTVSKIENKLNENGGDLQGINNDLSGMSGSIHASDINLSDVNWD